MASNPIVERKPENPKAERRTAQEWADRGNRILAGIEPMTGKNHAGQYMRRDDVRWVVKDGRCVIEWV